MGYDFLYSMVGNISQNVLLADVCQFMEPCTSQYFCFFFDVSLIIMHIMILDGQKGDQYSIVSSLNGPSSLKETYPRYTPSLNLMMTNIIWKNPIRVG